MTGTPTLKELVRRARERDTARDTERDTHYCPQNERDSPSGTPQNRPFRGSYQELAASGLVARIRIAWPWLAEHRPDLYQAVIDADEQVATLEPASPGYPEALTRLEMAMEMASAVWEQRTKSECAQIYSRILDAEVWIAATEEAAAELHREGVTLPVLLPSEAEVLAGMAEADAQALLSVLAKIQRANPRSRLRSLEGGTDV